MSTDIDKERIIAELDALLASPCFRSRKVIKRFLHYVVHETLAGRGDTLNQQNIAIHALGKPADFSPAYNPLVRIEAGRLRTLLKTHYAKADNPSSVMITIPKGAYQAAFALRNSSPQIAISTDAPLTPQITEGPRVLLRYQVLETSQTTHAAALCHKLRNDLLLVLNRFRNIRVVAGDAQDRAKLHQTDYTLNCDLQITGTDVELFLVLVHALNDELVWADTLHLTTQPSQHELDKLWTQIAANTVAVHSGKMLYHWAQYQQSMTTPVAAHYTALVDYLAFLHDITRENFHKALMSCQQRLQHFPHDSKALVILARLCGYDHVLQYHLIVDLETTWTHAARTALKLDPDNAEAHSIFAHNRYFLGDNALCRCELETARQLNPFDTSVGYLYGFGLYMTGDHEAGIQAIRELMALPFPQPNWYYVLPFLHTFNKGNYQAALVLAERIQYFGYWGELARSVSCFRLGQTAHSLRELQELLRHNSQLLDSANTDNRSIFSHEALKKVLDTLGEIKKLMTSA
ncbi:MAG: hypothetical protein BWK73_06535 [Thiothrix lacustris]|uniref:Adenylate cyclase n=1 Tax=Thiothrix lacustris TaxID=525917 RepID=A0A1Y1QWI0_9GAMM|nr:MAG: hypothetical protein BWK73_06535 [Thiothrix lacustris]